jgi:thiamine biosynthesis protein ThiC
MPAKSKAQQKFMSLVYALKKGDVKPSDVSQNVKDVEKSMKTKDVKDFASTKHKGLPNKVEMDLESLINKIDEEWSDKYKKSIDCNNAKGFSQRVHCQGKKKRN